MVMKTNVLIAVIIVALAQYLGGCISNEGDGVAPPADKPSPAAGEAAAPPASHTQVGERDAPPAVKAQAGKREVGSPEARAQIPPGRPEIVQGNGFIAGREGWTANALFTGPNELQICKVISSRDQERLKALLESGVELNTPGKFGFTLLYWAYVEGNLEAFKLLLEHGADPDHRLTHDFRWSEDGPVENLYTERGARYFFPFVKGHSIFFTTLQQFQPAYCCAALKYSKNVNQLDHGDRGENMLHRFLITGTANPVGLRMLIDAGVDLNAKGRFGLTPCRMALMVDPALCLQLLEAGADPGGVAEDLESALGNLPEGQQQEVYDPLIQWFREHGREIRPTKAKGAKSEAR